MEAMTAGIGREKRKKGEKKRGDVHKCRRERGPPFQLRCEENTTGEKKRGGGAITGGRRKDKGGESTIWRRPLAGSARHKEEGDERKGTAELAQTEGVVASGRPQKRGKGQRGQFFRHPWGGSKERTFRK